MLPKARVSTTKTGCSFEVCRSMSGGAGSEDQDIAMLDSKNQSRFQYRNAMQTQKSQRGWRRPAACWPERNSWNKEAGSEVRLIDQVHLELSLAGLLDIRDCDEDILLYLGGDLERTQRRHGRMMDPLVANGSSTTPHKRRDTLPPLPPGSPYSSPNPSRVAAPSQSQLPASSWPSAPLVHPNTVGSYSAPDPSIVWPHRAGAAPSSSMQDHHAQAIGHQPIAQPAMQQGAPPTQRGFEPRSPVRQDDRRMTGSLDGGPAKGKRPELGVTRLRVIGVERNRRDLFVKFDAHVSFCHRHL